MKKYNLICLVTLVLTVGSARAATTEIRLPDDASGLNVVSVQSGQVVVGQTCTPAEVFIPESCVSQFGPGLRVEVSYHAKNAFRELTGASLLAPAFADFGTEQYDVPGATGLMTAQLVRRPVSEQVVDEDNSKLCRRNAFGEKDNSCREHVHYKAALVNRTFLSLETR